MTSTNFGKDHNSTSPVSNYLMIKRGMFPFLAFLFILCFSNCSKEDDPQIDDMEKHEAYQSILNEFQEFGFPGLSALVYTSEDGIWQGTAGFANLENSVPLQKDAIMYAGSVTKLYTVATALTMAEEGLIELDDPISDYLSQNLVENLPNAKTATIRQLMNHTAGMPDIDNQPEIEYAALQNNGILPPAEEQLSWLFDLEPLFPAGTNAEYSSSHTMTLALIIDNVIDGHHSAAITEKIIDKLNLNETYYQNEAAFPSPEGKVNAYALMDDGTTQNIDEISTNWLTTVHGDAGVIASANDYYRFLKNLIEGNIINNNHLELMKSPYWLFDVGDVGFGFGLGFFVSKSNNEIYKIGHSGSTLGGNAHVYYYPQKEAYLVLLTNATILREDLDQIWTGEFPIPNEESIMGKFESLMLN